MGLRERRERGLSHPMYFRFALGYWPAAAALLVFGFTVWLLLPGMVITLDDDFWYLRSVVKTIQKGRPWTDDWLTPWAASCSLISACIFKITGSFSFAIHLQLAVAAGMAGSAMTIFLKRQGLGGAQSLAATASVLLCPTVLFMFLMFTGVAVYLACLWWCLLLADQRRWGWFLLPWALAMASRQSAIVWLALPFWHWLMACLESRSLLPRSREGWTLTAALPAAAAMFLVVKLGMNPTEGQKLIVGGLNGSLTSGRMLLPLGLGAVAGLSGLGVTALLRMPGVWMGAGGRRNRFRLALLPLLALSGAWALPWFAGAALNTHDCYRDAFTATWLPVLGAGLGAALAIAGSFHVRRDAILAAGGSLLLVAIYAGQFDYYYIEIFCFCLVAGWPSHTAPATDGAVERPSVKSRWLLLGGATLLTLGTGWWHGRSLIRLAAQQDRAAGVITLYEQTLRSGRLAPQDIGMTTFGYHGWLFQDYYAAHEGRQNPVLGGFTRYGQAWDNTAGTGILTDYSKALRSWRGIIPTRNNAALKDAAGLVKIAELETGFLHFFKVRYQLLRGNTAGPAVSAPAPDPSVYQRIPFPLNDAEWRQLILGPRAP